MRSNLWDLYLYQVLEWLQMVNTWTICEEKVLGRGRNGKVINLMAPTMGVLKCMGYAINPDADNRLEANVMAELHHPNICGMYGAVRHLGKDYLLLERLGQPLQPKYQRRSGSPFLLCHGHYCTPSFGAVIVVYYMTA